MKYSKWREDYPYPFAEGVIVVIQGFIILGILTLLSTLNFIPRKVESQKTYAFVSLVVLYLINHYRYKERYVEIIREFDKIEDPNRKLKGILIILLILVVISFPIIVGILRNNYGLVI